MKCLVINLDRSSDRLAHVTAEFSRSGLAFERVAAIDAVDRPDLSRLATKRMSSVEVACLLSHRACWATIAAGADSHAAVFEDDVVLSARAGDLLGDAGWIPADADIVKIETFRQKISLKRKRISCGSNFTVSRLLSAHIGAAGYILSKQAARDLFDATENADTPVDQLIFNPLFPTSSSKVIYQLIPAICMQDRLLGKEGSMLPSLLKSDRARRSKATRASEKGMKNAVTKTRTEIKRLVIQIVNIWRLRQRTIIPFEQRGRLATTPHTQHRQNAL